MLSKNIKISSETSQYSLVQVSASKIHVQYRTVYLVQITRKCINRKPRSVLAGFQFPAKHR